MKDILHSINSNIFTFSALAIGYLLIDDLSPSEQNSIGNWFMLVGQVLSTNSAQQQVLNNQKDHIINDNNISTLKKSVKKVYDNLENFEIK